MTSVVKVTADPVDGLQCLVEVHDYKKTTIMNSETCTLKAGETLEFHIYGGDNGRMITVKENRLPPNTVEDGGT